MNDTADRLLHAAAAVFAQEGILGATTRHIAKAAGVNEVTLFRHFQNKQKLLSAVLAQVFSREPVAGEPLRADADLTALLRGFADFYHARISEHLLLIRALIGEIHRCQEMEIPVVQGIFRPHRQHFVEQLQAAQAREIIRADANLYIAADQLSGMIFSGLLRGSLCLSREYSAEEYLAGCVETVARALAP